MRAAFRGGCDSVLLQLPTGGGKTVMAADMVRTAHARGKRAMFVVHRDFLVDQAVETITQFGVRCGVIQAGHETNLDAPMQIAMVQTLTRRVGSEFFLDGLRVYGLPDIVFWDEAHHVASATSKRIATALRKECKAAGKRLYQVGLTATPNRLDGRPLDMFQAMVQGPTVRWLIRNNHLCGFEYVKPTTTLGAFRSQLSTRMGDFDTHQQQELVHRRVRLIAGETVDLYREWAPGRRAIFFGVGVEHSTDTAARFREAGIPAEHIDASTLGAHRADVLRRFAAGETKVLCNVNIVGEGFDVPSAECVIMARHTQSVTMALQQVGRALRYEPGKTAVVIDQAGNHASVGFPDADREWTLAGRKRNRRGARASTPHNGSSRACPKCGMFSAVNVAVCPACGERLIEELAVQSYRAKFDVVHRVLKDHPATGALPGFRQAKLPAYRRIRELGADAAAIADLFREMGHPDAEEMGRAWADTNARTLGEGRRAGKVA